MPNIVVIGAHTAMASAFVELVEERELDVQIHQTTTTPFVTDGLSLLTPETVAGADLFVVCMEDDLIRTLVEKTDRPVLDLIGVDPEQPASFFGLSADTQVEGVCRIPVGMAEPIAAVLDALSPFGPKQAFAAVLESAAVHDQVGMDQLSQQIRALFNMQDPEDGVFEHTLAFNLLPADDATGLEADLALATGLPVSALRATAPTFSAEMAFLQVQVDDPNPSAETVAAALTKGRGLRHTIDLTATSALGRDDALVGRISVGPHRIGTVVACDRLRRGSATLACLAVERWLQ